MVGEKHQGWRRMGEDQARRIEKPHLLMVGYQAGRKNLIGAKTIYFLRDDYILLFYGYLPQYCLYGPLFRGPSELYFILF